jgi:hypothetical protein
MMNWSRTGMPSISMATRLPPMPRMLTEVAPKRVPAVEVFGQPLADLGAVDHADLGRDLGQRPAHLRGHDHDRVEFEAFLAGVPGGQNGPTGHGERRAQACYDDSVGWQ